MLIINNLSKHLGTEQVLNNVSLSLHSHELTGLIGASGAGKTVFSRCLVGLLAWDSGTLEVDGVSFDTTLEQDAPEWQAVRKKIGLVAQNRALPPYRTISELVAEGAQYVLRLPSREVHRRTEFWIDRLGLSMHSHKYPAEVSGGQLARVCLARALVMQPDYLVCDEVTANLDPLMAADVAGALLDIASTGVSVLMISHQLEFLRSYAARISFLSSGVILASGTPNEILENPIQEELKDFVKKSELGR